MTLEKVVRDITYTEYIFVELLQSLDSPKSQVPEAPDKSYLCSYLHYSTLTLEEAESLSLLSCPPQPCFTQAF
jgi:hypothetical protein